MKDMSLSLHNGKIIPVMPFIVLTIHISLNHDLQRRRHHTATFSSKEMNSKAMVLQTNTLRNNTQGSTYSF